MITINRNDVRTLRRVLRAAFGVTARSRGPNVTLSATAEGLLVRATDGQIAVEHELTGSAAGESTTLPYAVLASCEDRRPDPVTITLSGKKVNVEWIDAGVPQRETFPSEKATSWPDLPAELTANDPTLLTILREAIKTTDRESSRYALGCLRLRGRDGQVAATDGRQAYVSWGHDFPWEGDVLIPANRVLECGEFTDVESIAIGKTDDWVAVRCGTWTIGFKIEKDARFPAVEDHIPDASEADTTLHFVEADATFAAEAIKRLPCDDTHNQPVTVDLNGEVVVRSKGSDQPATELVLSGSCRAGAEVAVATNREYLARALRLGFRDIYFRGADAPACCKDDRRAFIWALLGKDGCIKADAQAVRIESQLPQQPTNTRRRTKSSMKANTPNQNGHPTTANQGSERETVSDLIQDAEELKTSLRDILGRTSQLVAGLKRQRRDSKRIRSAVLSLKQLQAIDA